jgi:hypothetical protein
VIDLYYWTTSNCHKQINIQPTVSEESKSVLFWTDRRDRSGMTQGEVP